MPAIDFKSALGNPTSVDHANIEIQGMRVSRTVKMALFTINENAVRQGDYILSRESYPIARIRFTANRNVFRLQPGDPFKFVFPKYGITEMICRVVFIEEEDVESEKITVTAMEESINATQPITTYTEPDNYRRRRPSGAVEALTPCAIVETPYALVGEELVLTFLVPKRTGNEAGYHIYMSQDGTEYYKLKSSSFFQVHGTLAEDYPETTTIDDERGVLIDFDSAQNLDLLQSISLIELLGNRNTSIIGDEFVTFQTVTPVTASQYRLTGVYRGRWGTVNKAHSTGENFYFNGVSVAMTRHATFLAGSTRYFKFIPYSTSQTGSLGGATVYSHTFTGEAFKPYEVINLKVNDDSYWPTYDGVPSPSNMVLTWHGRIRGQGTGIGDPSVVTDSAHTYEGLFRLKFYLGRGTPTTPYRTVDAVDAETYTYTAATLLSDQGHYPSYITVGVSNYLTGEGSVEYESDEEYLLVRKSGTLTTTTTSTTVTVSTTTTTTV